VRRETVIYFSYILFFYGKDDHSEITSSVVLSMNQDIMDKFQR